MNKWMKAGMAGLILGAATLAVANPGVQTSSADEIKGSDVVIDVVEGGSKLKDRNISAEEKQKIEFVRALIDIV